MIYGLENETLKITSIIMQFVLEIIESGSYLNRSIISLKPRINIARIAHGGGSQLLFLL